jgi:hypothetical protein
MVWFGCVSVKNNRNSYCRFGVTLLAIMDADCTSANSDHQIQLNPGSSYKLKKSDFCFYMSVSKEENTKLSHLMKRTDMKSQREKNYRKLTYRSGVKPVLKGHQFLVLSWKISYELNLF